MTNIRRYEEVKESIQNSINFYEARIKAWENVSFPTKKDGTQFKVLSKNFEGAKIGVYYPVEDYGNPYLTVCGEEKHGNNTRYFSDHMEIYMSRYNDRLPLHNPEREIRTSYGVEVEILTVDEIKAEIEALIDRYKKYKLEAERQLEISEEVFSVISAKISEIKDIFSKYDIEHETLGYAMEKYIEHAI